MVFFPSPPPADLHLPERSFLFSPLHKFSIHGAEPPASAIDRGFGFHGCPAGGLPPTRASSERCEDLPRLFSCLLHVCPLCECAVSLNGVDFTARVLLSEKSTPRPPARD